MLACVPFIGLSVASLSMLMSSSSTEGTTHYSNAGGVATEVIKTRASFSRYVLENTREGTSSCFRCFVTHII